MAEDELQELDDAFDANNPDDMSDFMNLLDNIELDNNELEQEIQNVNDADIAQTIEADNPFADKESMYNLTDEETQATNRKVDNMMSELGLIDKNDDMNTYGQEESAFTTPEDGDILSLLDAVGGDDQPIPEGDVAPEDMADKSVGELADILAGMDATEPDISSEDGFVPDGLGIFDDGEQADPIVKKNFIQRLIERFRKVPTPEELMQQELEESQEKEWEEQQQQKASEKKARKAEEKEAKKAESDKKKQEAAEAKKVKQSARQEAKAAKKAQKAAKNGIPVPASQLVPVKPLVAFVIVGIAICVVLVTFTNHWFYKSSIKDAKEYFIHQKYRQAYEAVLGLDVKKKDQKFCDQVTTIRMVQKDLEAYQNYVNVKDYEMALESLVKGIGKYQTQAEQAKKLNLENEMHDIYEDLVKEVTTRFDMTAQDAQSLYEMKDRTQYAKQIEQIARDAAIRDGIIEKVEVSEVQE